MKRIISIFLFFALLLPAILSRPWATQSVACLQLDKKTVVIGDSNTVRLKNDCSDVRAATIYARINGTIGECVNNWGYLLSDYGGDYNKTMKQLIDALSGEDFHTVVINMGTNHLGGSMRSYQQYYQLLLDRLYEKNATARIYLCKILPVNPAQAKGKYAYLTTNENVQLVNDAVEELYQTNLENGRNVALIDYNTPFRDGNGNLASAYSAGDGMHLNRSGTQKMNLILQQQLARDSAASVHSYAEIGRTAPSCTEEGRSTLRCAACQKELSSPLPPLGHLWTLREVLADPAGDVHGSALYECERCGAGLEDELCASIVFTDAPPRTHWAHNAVDWALANHVTSGTSPNTFGPELVCTRAQVVTFLWRVSGSPEAAVENPFADVPASAYYFDALLWALESQVTSGTSETSFSPDQSCTRAQIVTMLWRAAGSPEPAGEEMPFADVAPDAYYAAAVQWAVEQQITAGTSADSFSPDRDCTRAQIVTFLYKYAALAEAE